MAHRSTESRSDGSLSPRQAQEILIALGGLGRLLTETINSRVHPDLSGNATVIVVTHLDLQGPLRPAQIATLTGMTRGGVAKLLDKLEAGGYVTRTIGAVPDDKRATIVGLTPKGEQVARVYAEAVLDAGDEVEGALARLLDTMDQTARE